MPWLWWILLNSLYHISCSGIWSSKGLSLIDGMLFTLFFFCRASSRWCISRAIKYTSWSSSTSLSLTCLFMYNIRRLTRNNINPVKLKIIKGRQKSANRVFEFMARMKLIGSLLFHSNFGVNILEFFLLFYIHNEQMCLLVHKIFWKIAIIRSIRIEKIL